MNLKNRRIECGFTQEYLANLLGINRSTVSMWETGESMPRADKLPKLAAILGCSINDIFSEQKDAS